MVNIVRKRAVGYTNERELPLLLPYNGDNNGKFSRGVTTPNRFIVNLATRRCKKHYFSTHFTT